MNVKTMDTKIKIYINNDLDIVMARMQTRGIAKEMGFSTADQARISLAASELARLLAWSSEPNEMVISNAVRNGSHGLQMVCMVQQAYISESQADGSGEEPNLRQKLVGACGLVDESSVEVQNDQQVRVTLTKWLKS